MGKNTKEAMRELLKQKRKDESISSFGRRVGKNKGTISYWMNKLKATPTRKRNATFEPISIESSFSESNNSFITIKKENINLEIHQQVSPEYIKTILGW